MIFCKTISVGSKYFTSRLYHKVSYMNLRSVVNSKCHGGGSYETNRAIKYLRINKNIVTIQLFTKQVIISHTRRRERQKNFLRVLRENIINIYADLLSQYFLYKWLCSSSPIVLVVLATSTGRSGASNHQVISPASTTVVNQ